MKAEQLDAMKMYMQTNQCGWNKAGSGINQNIHWRKQRGCHRALLWNHTLDTAAHTDTHEIIARFWIGHQP